MGYSGAIGASRMLLSLNRLQPPMGLQMMFVYSILRKVFISLLTFTDNTAPILSQLTPRDRVNANTDWAQIIINPFNDGSNDFNFYLSAAGVQGDSRATNDDDEDGSWNAVWYSTVVKTEHAWKAEIFIPYRVLRMPETKRVRILSPGGSILKDPFAVRVPCTAGTLSIEILKTNPSKAEY